MAGRDLEPIAIIQLQAVLTALPPAPPTVCAAAVRLLLKPIPLAHEMVAQTHRVPAVHSRRNSGLPAHPFMVASLPPHLQRLNLQRSPPAQPHVLRYLPPLRLFLLPAAGLRLQVAAPTQKRVLRVHRPCHRAISLRQRSACLVTTVILPR